ncbi:hypothetical protein E2C01_041119 [Portunus trituberculatus]|uniref:Uncharacterized protein n=1 Tax=Portunus trituberculatus TaxID=210409 RepID=A0A5B7FPG7_PORTR|nr:hypothetical protein [Portunus trituberculatus]
MMEVVRLPAGSPYQLLSCLLSLPVSLGMYYYLRRHRRRCRLPTIHARRQQGRASRCLLFPCGVKALLHLMLAVKAARGGSHVTPLLVYKSQCNNLWFGWKTLWTHCTTAAGRRGDKRPPQHSFVNIYPAVR